MYLVIYNDFNENEFDNRLKVLEEYMKRTNAISPLPEHITYVSDVDGSLYTLTTFNVKTLNVVQQTHHDDNYESFDFLQQSLVPVEHNNEPRLKPDPLDNTKYLVRGDDGWIQFSCPHNEKFENDTCVPIEVCDNLDIGNHGLTSHMIDRLVFNRRFSSVKESSQNDTTHPVLYLRCLSGGSHVIEECPPNHLYDVQSRSCQLTNVCKDRPDGFILNTFNENLDINQYYVCQNQTVQLATCPVGQIFDRNLLECREGFPCEIFGEGHTFITSDIGPNQYYLCTSISEKELITCVFRSMDSNGKFSCSGDTLCSVFAQGTGTQIKVYEDDTLSFNQGLFECKDFQVSQDVTCDTSNLIVDKLFNNRFTVDVHLPKEIYDVNLGACVPFNSSLVRLKNNFYLIDYPNNEYELNFNTMFSGVTQRINDLLRKNDFDNMMVLYARDINDSMGVNVITGNSIQCFGSYLYDAFNGYRVNFCDTDGHTVVSEITFTDEQYFQPRSVSVAVDKDLGARECWLRMNTVNNYVEMDVFTTKITTNIRQSDVCNQFLDAFAEKYTTLWQKYTTPKPKIYYKNENSVSNTGVYPANILKSDIVNKDIDTLQPLFNIFETYETLNPMFNPFNDNHIEIEKQEDNEPEEVTPPTPEEEINPPDELDPEINVPEESAPPEEIETIKSNSKILDYSCFYSLPTFKLTTCIIEEDFIQTAIQELRSNVKVDSLCENAVGLANVINSYAYLGNSVGCKSNLNADLNTITINRIEDGAQFLNLETQSNDHDKYNLWIHKNGEYYVACPPELLQSDFSCAVEKNKLYFIEDLQS